MLFVYIFLFIVFVALSVSTGILYFMYQKMLQDNIQLKDFPEKNPMPVFRVDKDGILIYANDASQYLLTQWNSGLGKPVAKELNALITNIQAGVKYDSIDLKVGTKYFKITGSKSSEQMYSFYGTNITELKLSKDELQKGLTKDVYSGLPNRFLFYQTLEFEIKHANGSVITVLMLHIDNWYEIQGSFGVKSSEATFIEVYKRIREITGNDTFIARVGERELALIDTNNTIPEDISNLCTQIVQSIKKPIVIDGNPIRINCSMGVTLYPDDGKNQEELLRNAHLAVNRAKVLPNLKVKDPSAQPQLNYAFFQNKMLNQVTNRISIVNELANAISKDQFELYYQPKVALNDMSLKGAEALIRWHHPEKGLLGPFHFIETAEDHNLTIKIGQWVIQDVCRQAKNWLDKGYEIPISINISPKQIHHSNVLDDLKKACVEFELSPEFVEIEITEKGLGEDKEKGIEFVKTLKEAGFSVAIDDFGTGLSSLTNLLNYEPNVLKMDRYFLENITDQTSPNHITRGIIELGHSLDLSIVAEGIETTDQFEYLSKIGCDIGQGYYFGKPVPVKDFERVFPE